MKNALKLYLVTDRSLSLGRSLEEVIVEAVKGGVTMVQLREKECSTSEFVEQAMRLKQVLAPYNVPLIINDRVDVALAVDADGVHIGQSDMPYELVRQLLGNQKIIGLSVESMDKLHRANQLDVDYIGISPVFATSTKTDTATPFGIEGLRRAVEQSVHPTVAIGGMNATTIPDVLATGVNGVAVVSAICSAPSPFQAASNLISLVNRHRVRIDSYAVNRPLGQRSIRSCGLCTTYHTVLSIAGSDSGGGAGVQADIKTISALGCYAASAITAVTVQNTLGVEAVHPVPLDIVVGQIDTVLSDIGADAVKIGMLHSAEVVKIVANKIEQYSIKNVVLDPVMVSTSGHRLIEESAISALKKRLLPLARVVTPNVPEAEILIGRAIKGEEDFREVAKMIGDTYGVSVLLKAGHLSGDTLTDYFYNKEEDSYILLPSKRVETKNTHGTGCTLSSALAAVLARGEALNTSVRSAKHYIEQAIIAGAEYVVGKGHGPVKHFWQ